tara:strand:- start:6584 stop:8701 length:2118 start_codon:yes stop_codon:yes gene_type:complete
MTKNLIEINLTKNLFPSFNVLVEQLVGLNYSRVEMVFEPGDFSIKGNIIDIFCHSNTYPLRIEYDLDDIDRLSLFYVNNQRSFKDLTDVSINAFENDTVFYNDKKRVRMDESLLSQFFIDDYIVHEYYGIGLFKGLSYQKFSSVEGEYVCLEYKDKSLVYVPLDQLNLIHKYNLQDSPPSLNSLSEKKWLQTKKKAERDTLEIAEELYDRYKRRQSAVGFTFSEDSLEQLEMEALFEHELTPDQKRALAEIKNDMETSTPMDRLLCGDVGFGKTEIMLRAAFKAVDNYKQVVILVPTTLLADQHFKLFSKRFEQTPYIIKMLSRFVSKSDQKAIIKGISEQKCDIVIGTHRLLSKDIVFKDLGLLIIDEEQRFGVKHKEKIKEFKEAVDVLNVTATPIPRTTYMSLTGSKDISIIETPPPFRKPIQTFVAKYSDELIKKAINQEVERKGQVFFIHNRVETIDKKVIELKKMFPSLRILMVHAQMTEEKIKAIMISFLNYDCDILVSTTIIENGIDIKNANTIIIDSSERFGLSQIHQLRGRVGRSDIQSYAYLLFSDKKILSEKAKQRLQAIKEYVNLGSGYHLALKDLEIRGAGNILGQQQFGHLLKVGFSYYCKLLEDSISNKKGQYNARFWMPLRTDKIRISENYIPNQRERIAIYTRFMTCKSFDDLSHLKDELQDRYGRLPFDEQKVFDYIYDEIEKHGL